MPIAVPNTKVSSNSGASSSTSNVSLKRFRPPSVPLLIANSQSGSPTPPESPPTPTESPRVPCAIAELETPPKTVAVSPEELGSEPSQPLPTPIELAREGAGVLPSQPPSNPTKVQGVAVADQEAPPEDANAVIGERRVLPGPVATANNFTKARNLVEKYVPGVKMRWGGCHDKFSRWHIVYKGPEHLLDEAAMVGESCLSYAASTPQDQGEFALVAKW